MGDAEAAGELCTMICDGWREDRGFCRSQPVRDIDVYNLYGLLGGSIGGVEEAPLWS